MLIQSLKQSVSEASTANQQAREAYEAKERKYQEELTRVQRKLARYQQKRGDLIPTFDWVKTFVHPLAQAVQEELRLGSYEVYGPFGLRAEVSIYWHELPDGAGDPIYHLTVIPRNLKEGVIHYDIGRQTSTFAKGTIGALNGFANETAPLPDTLEELIHHLKTAPSMEV